MNLWAPVTLGEWLHVAATLDDATGATKFYVNGEVVAQTVTTVRPFGDLDPAYATDSGTAAAGSDFTSATGTVTFAPGQAARTVQVAVLDDGHLNRVKHLS